MVLVCLPSDALLQRLLSYLGFSYLGCGVSLHGCHSKAQSLLLTLDEGYLLTATPLDLERGIAPLSSPETSLSKTLIQFSADWWSCTPPSELFGLLQPSPGIYGLHGRVNGDLQQDLHQGELPGLLLPLPQSLW